MRQEKQVGREGGRGSRSIITVGFGAMLVLLLALGLGWLTTVRQATEKLNQLVGQYENAMRVVAMRDAAQGRMLALSRMAMTQDPFRRDEEYLEFTSLASKFIAARDGMLAAGLRPEEQAIWFEARDLVRLNSDAQSEVVDLLLKGEQEFALNRIANEVTLRQKAIHAELQKQQALMQEHVRSELEQVGKEGRLDERAAISLGVVTLILGVAVMWFVLVRSSSAERALILAREEAQRANHLKSLFLANMSHEIRTPLTAVIGFAEKLVHDHQSRKSRQEAAQIIYNSGNHLISIVNDILDLSKIEAGQILVDRVNFAPHEILQALMRQWQPHAQAKGIRLEVKYEFPLPATIHSDPVRFQQILSNLISNAIKFTGKGEVRLGLRYGSELKQILVSVTDTGIGMSEEEQGRIFAPFEQADASTTRKYGGTGLGLAIARHLAHLLHGSLHCTSVKGQGTCFSLDLPTGIDDGAVPWIESVEQLGTSGPPAPLSQSGVPHLIGHILLAEDTIENQQLIESYVKRTGASIVTVGDGQQAVERMEREDFDLVLMDVQMPVLGGVEAAIELRSRGFRQPIIAITANVLAEDVARYVQAGMTEVIEKPFNSAKFYDVISKHLEHAHVPDAMSMPDDYDELKDIRAGFIARLPGITLRLRDALPNWQVLQFETHQLKGLGGTLGFPEIGQAAKEANDTLRSEDYELALERVEQLLSVIDAVQTRLARQSSGELG